MKKKRKELKTNLFLKVNLFFLGVILFFFYLKSLGGNFLVFERIISLPYYLLPLFFVYKSLKFFGFNSFQGKIVFFLGLGIFLSFLAGFFNIFQNQLMQVVKQIFFLIAYIFLVIGVILGINIIDFDFFKKKLKVFSLFSLLILVLFLGFFFKPLNNQNFLSNSYYFFDLILLSIIIIILVNIFMLRQGSYGVFWIYIGLGMFSIFSSNLLRYFRIGEVIGVFSTLGFYLSSYFFTLAFRYLEIESRKIISSTKK